ncbi:complement C2 [Genypterus blacodes]|uniref:complement C2 n=1 Tax=Genypterus blacodes TaxID=154954 RepID=UPI003F762D00
MIMFGSWLPWILLCIVFQKVYLQEEEYDYYAVDYMNPPPLNCSTTEGIRGGHVTYSQGGLEGSVLRHHCGLGKYPFPVSQRLCAADGAWSAMRLPNGRPISAATCKDLLCPAQLQLDNGDFWPRNEWFRVGAVQSFSCHEGFTLSGSAERNCTLTGEWTGTTPICDNDADACRNPGIPPGGLRTPGRFQTGDKVVYRCQSGLDLLGSAERVCLEDREWSGSAPWCHGPHTFDSPSSVASAMGGSLAGMMDIFSPQFKQKETQHGRKLIMTDGSRMNIYILMDTSGSISKEDFKSSKGATVALIEKLSSYKVRMNFHVMSFASEVNDIMDIADTYRSNNPSIVIRNLEQFDYNSHAQKKGTNLHAALRRVSERINFFRQRRGTNHFNETHNIIIIETDGYSNEGGNPESALKSIRHLLGYNIETQDHTDETRLDVYVFGIGNDVNRGKLNAIASKKRNEEHIFILKDYESLGSVFNSMISDESVTMCGVAQEYISSEDDGFAFTKPWHVTLSMVGRGPCVGSIISEDWILTAAHCFARESTEKLTHQVQIKHGEGVVFSKRVIMHPNYNTNALKSRNVSEFYSYDIALVQVNKSIPLSWKARPICLPCTVPASRALKMLDSTCDQHREELLSHKDTAAFFIHKDSTRKQTHIHLKSQRPGCVEMARKTLKEPTDVTLDEYVPDLFLCSGGSSGHRDSITCKGDSGGSLFLEKKKRYFQVGVVSWGTVDVCSSDMRQYNSDMPHPDARDLHIDVFKIIPWLRQHLGEIQFLPVDG